MSNTLGERYASALLSIAVEENRNKDYRDYVKALLDCFDDNPKIINLLSSPFLNRKEKEDVLNQILVNCPFIHIKGLFHVIVDNQRERNIIDILKEFISLSNNHDGISEGFVYSAMKLDRKEIDSIQDAVSKKIGKEVYLKPRIDNELLGGVKVVINDFVFDSTLKYKLDQLKVSLERR